MLSQPDETVTKALDAKGWFQLFAVSDPYSTNWLKALRSEARGRALDVWMAIVGQFPPGTPAHVVLRNAWALARRAGGSLESSLEVVSTLATADDGEMAAVVAQIRANRKEAQKSKRVSWEDVLTGAAAEDSVAHGVTGLAPGLSLRIALGWLSRQSDRTARSRFAVLNSFPDCSRSTQARELQRSLLSGNVVELATSELATLPLRTQILLAEQPQLTAALVLGDASEASNAFDNARRRWKEQRALRALLRRFANALRNRRLDDCRQLARRISPFKSQESDLRHIAPLIISALTQPSDNPIPSEQKWAPISAEVADLISRLGGSRRLVEALKCDLSQLCERACADSTFLGRNGSWLPTRERTILAQSWKAKQVESLLVSGRVDLLNFVPVALAIRHLDVLVAGLKHPTAAAALSAVADEAATLDRILNALHEPAAGLRQLLLSEVLPRPTADGLLKALLKQAGTQVANGLLDAKTLRNDELLSRTLQAFQQLAAPERAPSAYALLASAVARLTTKNQMSVHTSNFVAIDARCKQALAECISPSRALWLAPIVGDDADFWAVLCGRFPGSMIPREVASALVAVDRPKTAWRLLRWDSSLLTKIGAMRWPLPTGQAEDPSIALAILANRHRAKRLAAIALGLSADRFKTLCREASQVLPAKSRDRAYLELISLAGPGNLRRLARAMAVADLRAQPGQQFDSLYHTYSLPKKSGGVRWITAPPIWLRRLQRDIYDALLAPLPMHEAAHGFVTGRSIVSNASQHVSQPVVVNCDISSCFPSVRWSMTLAALRRDFGATLSPVTISLLVDLCSHGGGLPIGAPTSPALLNRVLLKTDEILSQQALKQGCRYTRYADDITFSGGDAAVGLLAVTRSVLGKIGLKLDEKKTNVYRGGRRQVVTGLAVNRRVSVPRRIRRRLRAAVHALETGRLAHWHGEEVSFSSVRGRLAFMKSVNQEEAERLLRRLLRDRRK